MQTSGSALLNRLLARGKFRHVQVLLLLAELGSVQKSADAMGVTQSSVTQTLGVLEDLLEVRLFERHARGVRPTAACKDLLPVVRQMLTQISESADLVAAHRNTGQGVVRVIASATAIHGLLVTALPAFADRYPDTQVHLREAENEDQLLAIARGEVDVVVCRQPTVLPEGWVFHALREDRVAIICRSQHPLAKARSITPARLAKETWLLMPAGSAMRARYDELVATFPQAPNVYPVLSYSLTMMWWLVRQRNLLLLLAVQMARPLLDSGEFVELPSGQTPQMRPLGILQPAKTLGEAAERFSSFLRARIEVRSAAP